MNDEIRQRIVYKMVERVYKDVQTDIIICRNVGLDEAEYINKLVHSLKDVINLVSRYEIKNKNQD